MRRAGFSLLELMMATFVLAIAASILMGTQSTSAQMTSYANNLSVITMLTRAKMQDIEYEVLSEGFTEGYGDELNGDFGDQGYDDITWTARIDPVEIGDDAANTFVETINAQLYGEGEDDGTLSGNVAFSQFLPLMISYMPTIINQLGQRIRQVTLTVTWEYLGREQSLTVSQYIVRMVPPDEQTGITTDEDPPPTP